MCLAAACLPLSPVMELPGRRSKTMYNGLAFVNFSVADNVTGLDTMDGHEMPLTGSLSLEPSCILILIITGKVILNILILGARHRNVGTSLMGYCCVSLAIVDFMLLLAIAAIHYFQDFTVVGLRFTSYHICLFTQIISHTYGILHLPFLLASGLDYYLTIVKSIHIPCACSGLLYTACVVLLWTGAFAHVLLSPMRSPALDMGQSGYQCTFYISSQSFYLSIVLVCSIFTALSFCCFEIVAFLKSLKVISYARNTVVLFSFPQGDMWPVQGGKRLMAALLFSFLGTWAPFIVFQIVIIVLCAHIPGYMDMNVPWLYFMNSFLIGVSYGLKYPDLQRTENTFSKDPFISWKYCIMPCLKAEYTKVMPLRDEFTSSVMTV
ncbi:probable G-protein coupled receptor 160 isoform X4 [Hyla sarda]|uniref:probable G-protein coupled receptor 160 isoform X4 n=1 Tax=Hyla sarda TaxID=327740 RepID=UPI0024C2BD89|nr:probable G-protein coupled receptor 160 isoform X4 [Hyla sarda]